MRRFSVHNTLLAVAIFAALGAVAAIDAAAKEAKAAVPAQAGYDGQWVIQASTSSFFCPVKHKQLVATVQGGKVVKLSGLPGSVSGIVDRSGDVTIHIRLYGVTALVRGRVNGATGGGDWSANSMICGKGQWTAGR